MMTQGELQQLFNALSQAVPSTFPDRRYPSSFAVDDAYLKKEAPNSDARYVDGKIIVRSHATSLTVIHEYGHLIYDSIFRSELGKFPATSSLLSTRVATEGEWSALQLAGSTRAGLMLRFFDAVKSTPLYERCSKLNFGNELADHVDRNYFLSISENWANAFAHVFAALIKDQSALADLAAVDPLVAPLADPDLTDTRGYWPTDEFSNSTLRAHVLSCIQ